MIRMLLVGYVFAIRSERQLCSECRSAKAITFAFCSHESDGQVPAYIYFVGFQLVAWHDR